MVRRMIDDSGGRITTFTPTHSHIQFESLLDVRSFPTTKDAIPEHNGCLRVFCAPKINSNAPKAFFPLCHIVT